MSMQLNFSRLIAGLFGTFAMVAVLTSASLAEATAITNGDFETGDLTGWTLVAGAGGVINNQAIYDENFAADPTNDFFQNFGVGVVLLRQTGITVGGGNFALSGQFAQRDDENNSNATFVLELLTPGLVAITPDFTEGALPVSGVISEPDVATTFTNHYSNLAPGTYVVQVLISGGQGVADNISFGLVPEPSTGLLMSLGLFGLVSRRRRRL